MSKRIDWMPASRQEQLSMAQNWLVILNEKTKTTDGAEVFKYEAWSIPKESVTSLDEAAGTAENALSAAMNEKNRTNVSTSVCRSAFDKLTALMKNLKRRYFFTPPLAEGDLVSLGIKIHDQKMSTSGIPTCQVIPEIYLTAGPHELGIRVKISGENPDDNTVNGFRVYYSVVGPGENLPTDPRNLRKSFYTQRRNDVIVFEFDDSGKTAHIAIQIENGTKKGPWGPMVSELIP